MADVSPVSDGGPPDARLTLDIQRLLDLMQADGPQEADGLSSAEWATKIGRGQDATQRMITRLVRAGQMAFVGYQYRPNILGRMVQTPVYVLVGKPCVP